MCKIVEFPQKKELPIEVKNDIRKLAEDYVCVLLDALEYLNVNTDDIDKIEEVGKEITVIYVEELEKIVEGMDEL